MRNWSKFAVIVLMLFPLVVLAQQVPQPPAYLAFLNNPDITYLLLLIAVYGLFFEIANPGMIIPGLLGFLSFLVVIYSFLWMPVDLPALTLLLVGLIFMVFEAFVFSFGVMGFLGLIAFILGSMSLFDTHNSRYHVSWALIITMSVISLAFFFMAVHLAIRAHKKAIVTGKEGLIGREGVVLKISNDRILVRVLGEIWEAKSSQKLHTEQAIQVTQVNNLVLTVEPVKDNKQ